MIQAILSGRATSRWSEGWRLGCLDARCPNFTARATRRGIISVRYTGRLSSNKFCWIRRTFTAWDENEEELLGKALRDRRARSCWRRKFGTMYRGKGRQLAGHVKRQTDYVRSCCEARPATPRRLTVNRPCIISTGSIPETPIEENGRGHGGVGATGEVRYLGLSEAAPATIRRACTVHPITRCRTEYSLWTRDPEAEVLPTCREIRHLLCRIQPARPGGP